MTDVDFLFEIHGCAVGLVVPGQPVPAAPQLRMSTTWDELLATYQIQSVRDEIEPDFTTRFEILWPALEPGGRYEVTGSGTNDDVEAFARQYLRGARAESVAYLRRTLQRLEGEAGGAKLVKKEFRQARMFVVSQGEFASASVELLPPTFYERIVPTIIGSQSKNALAYHAHKGYQPQFAPRQSLTRVGECLVTGYGNIHPWPESVLEETFANARHTSTRGLLQRCGDTDWWSSVKDLTPHPDALVDGPCLILKQTWDANYGHWLVDGFARLAKVREHLDVSTVRVLVNAVPPPMDRVVRQCLQLFGISDEQIYVQGTHPVRVEEGWYPGPVSKAPSMKHPAAVDFLRSLVSSAAELGGTNHAPTGCVYLSRNRTAKRVLLNEDDLLPHLKSEGYCVVHPETLTLFDQICTLGSATHVVGNMGAAMANLAFSPSGVKVAALATPAMPHDYFYDIVCLKRGTYLGIQGEQSPGANIGSDFSLDLPRTLDALGAAGFLAT